MDESMSAISVNTTTGSDKGEKKRNIEMDSHFCKRSCGKLYLDGETADVRFIFNENDVEKKIPAHKYMLAIGSPVFKSMFYGDLKEEDTVIITDCSSESFKEFLQFFYLANVKLTIENAAEVMNLVNKYGTIDCFSVCEQFMMENFSMDIAIRALELALLFERNNFQRFVLKCMMDNPKELFLSDSFQNCTPDILKVILDCKDFKCDELLIFRSCMSWSNKACIKNNLDPLNMVNIRQQLNDCLYQIQFAAMKHHHVSTCVSEYSDLFTREELVELVAITSGDVNMKRKHFVCETRVKPMEWNDNAYMMFSTNGFTESLVKQSERTSFKSSGKLLLGAIATQIINSNIPRVARQIHGVLKICEMESTEETILLEQPFTAAIGGKYVPRNFTKLQSAIAISRNKIYAIQIDFDATFVADTFTTLKSLRYKQFSIQEHAVTFGCGIVSHLYFT